MAEKRLIKSQLRLIFENGIHPTTNALILKTKSFSNIKIGATAEQLYEVAQSLASLQELSLYQVERFDNSEITAD